ncbi:rho GTPase-activating protein 36 isoform X1 [Carcharodon carcharias]|uniref:rho GTPase-activating protein 36 isoform X1 n=2 Tax=Carcharodon carcharias TaxID=13397 RepID=UPI001B7EC8C4|nr:rho GTPase-activating protein 36 isoform X1 [Carcharodon carcharias]
MSLSLSLPTFLLKSMKVYGSVLGDFTWNTMFGQSVTLQPVPIQSLSELERARLQDVSFFHLQIKDLGCQIAIPKDGPKRRKSFRRKKDSLSKEKKDKELHPLGFGIPLSQVILNDCARKKKQDAVKEGRRDCLDLETTVMRFRAKKEHKHLYDSDAFLQSTSEIVNEPLSPTFMDNLSRSQRRGAVSVDSITDLDDNQSRLLEALQLSLPMELERKSVRKTKQKLSLNPIFQQVPRIVQQCCQHIENYGLQTVGIFRVGSSKKRVRQLRDEFDQGLQVVLDELHSVHDVAALLKEFLRDMPDPLLPKELYSAFINTMSMNHKEQLSTLQLLIYLLPPCNCDTLLRLLELLSRVASHAHDSFGQDGQEMTGNKMTAVNLATIFGPNLLHRENMSDKDYSVQAAQVEESSAIIGVIQKMIENYTTLFIVAPEFQHEVLMSLMQTDNDVVHYLLRRKLKNQSGSDEENEAFVMPAHHCSKSTCDSCSSISSDHTSTSISPRFCENLPVKDKSICSGSELFKVSEGLAFFGQHGMTFSAQSLKDPFEDTGEKWSFSQRRASRSHENLITTLRLETTKGFMKEVECRTQNATLVPMNSSPDVSLAASSQQHHQSFHMLASLNCTQFFTGSTEELTENTKTTTKLRRVRSDLYSKCGSPILHSHAAKMGRDSKNLSDIAGSSDNEYLSKKITIESGFAPQAPKGSEVLQIDASREGMEAKVWVKRDNGADSPTKTQTQQQLQHYNSRSDQKKNSLRETAV